MRCGADGKQQQAASSREISTIFYCHLQGHRHCSDAAATGDPSTFSFPLSTAQSRSSKAFLWPLCLTLFVGLMRRAALHIASHRSAVVYAKDFSKILHVKLRKCPSRSELTRCSSALLISLRCGAVGILQNDSKALSL